MTEDSILPTSVEADYEGDSDIADDQSVLSGEAAEEDDLEDLTEDVASDQPAKKKRVEVVSERRSKRLASRPEYRQRLQDCGDARGEKLWKEMEKKLFLQACKDHGTREVDKIIEKLPSKAPETVKTLIQREKKNQNFTIETQFVEEGGGRAVVIDDGENGRMRRTGEETDLPDARPRGKIVETLKRRQRSAPIEKWLDVVETRVEDQARKPTGDGSTVSADYSSIVPTMFQWISECEPQPSVAECGGVDYPAIYSYLGCLCQGEAPPDLNNETSHRIRQLLSTVIKVLQQQSLQKETDFLENYRGPQTKYRCEDGYDGNSEAVKNIMSLSQVPGMNPLAFHPEMFTEKQIPGLEDLIRITSQQVAEEVEEL